MDNYLPRIMDEVLEETLNYISAISIVGPAWCAKTTTASKFAKSILKMQDPDYSKSNILLVIQNHLFY